MTDRLARLEAQTAVLNSEIAKLRAERPAPPQPPRDEVRIVQVVDERSDLPTLADMRKLYNVVKHRVPEAKTHDPDAGFRGFCGAFRYVSNCGRIAAPNARLGVGYFIDDMKGWLRLRNAMTIDTTGSSFIAAALASGDILYVPHNSMMGHVWEFGIVPPNHGGKPADANGWRKVLDGSILAPSQPARRDAPPPPVRVVVGGY
jgi:hypothetical protein